MKLPLLRYQELLHNSSYIHIQYKYMCQMVWIKPSNRFSFEVTWKKKSQITNSQWENPLKFNVAALFKVTTQIKIKL